LVNNRVLFQITAECDSYISFFFRAIVTEIIARYSKSVFFMGERLLKVLPIITKLVDLAVDWMQFESG
jgi:hypothetical protein